MTTGLEDREVEIKREEVDVKIRDIEGQQMRQEHNEEPNDDPGDEVGELIRK